MVYLLGYGVHLETQTRSSLVDKVDSLIWQESLGDIAVRQLYRGDDCLILDTHAVVTLVALLKTSHNRDSILGGRLVDHNLLESSLKGFILLEVLLVLVERRSTYGAQLATRQCRLQDVGSIHSSLALTCAHKRVYLVDKEQHTTLGRDNLLNYCLESLLELALVLCTSHQRTHIQRVYHLVLQILGHIATHYTLGNALGNGGLTHTRLADKYRVVLRSARQNLQHATYLLIAANHRVETPSSSTIVEVYRILTQRVKLQFVALGVYGSPFAKLLNGGDKLVVVYAIASQYVACRAALLSHSNQQMLYRGVTIGECARKVDSSLHHGRALAREEHVACGTLYAWQALYSLSDLTSDGLDVYAHTTEEVARERLILGNGSS